MLPSGNVVILIQMIDDDWICQYTELSRARGEVVFSALFLQRHSTPV